MSRKSGPMSLLLKTRLHCWTPFHEESIAFISVASWSGFLSTDFTYLFICCPFQKISQSTLANFLVISATSAWCLILVGNSGERTKVQLWPCLGPACLAGDVASSLRIKQRHKTDLLPLLRHFHHCWGNGELRRLRSVLVGGWKSRCSSLWAGRGRHHSKNVRQGLRWLRSVPPWNQVLAHFLQQSIFFAAQDYMTHFNYEHSPFFFFFFWLHSKFDFPHLLVFFFNN